MQIRPFGSVKRELRIRLDIRKSVTSLPAMVPAEWLKPDLVLAQQDDVALSTLRQRVAEKMASVAGLPVARVESALLEATAGEGYSIGSGVAIPHIELPELSETFVCLVTLKSPLTLKSIDGKPVEVMVFILSKPDPHAHLLLLAHIARLAQSRTFLDGLRRSQTTEEIIQLVRAAEMRHRVLRLSAPQAPASTHALFVISLGGEKIVDSLLVDLVDLGFGDASVLEAQSLREAAANEVPLFAGFRDLFGDPGGRRILIIQSELERSETLIAAVKQVADEHKSEDARISVIPLQTTWSVPRIESEAPSKEH
jgi:nitrogen PTS system EIIA component